MVFPGNDEQTCSHLWQVCEDFPGDLNKAALHVSVSDLNVNWSYLCQKALWQSPLLPSGYVIMICKLLKNISQGLDWIVLDG